MFEHKIHININDRNCCEVKDFCHYTAKHSDTVNSICNLKCSVLKEIPVVFIVASSYGYHFNMKKLARA